MPPTDAVFAQILHVEDIINELGSNCNHLVDVGDLLLKVLMNNFIEIHLSQHRRRRTQK